MYCPVGFLLFSEQESTGGMLCYPGTGNQIYVHVRLEIGLQATIQFDCSLTISEFFVLTLPFI